MTAQGLRRPDVDWGEKVEVVNVTQRENERRNNAGVSAHGEAMPNEGIALM